MAMPSEIKVVRDVLDKLLVDPANNPIGRADGVVMVIDNDDAQPRLARIEFGPVVLARRVGPRTQRLVLGIARRFSIVRRRRSKISWHELRSIGIQLKIDGNADRFPGTVWEAWLVRRIFKFIPGGTRE